MTTAVQAPVVRVYHSLQGLAAEVSHLPTPVGTEAERITQQLRAALDALHESYPEAQLRSWATVDQTTLILWWTRG